MLMLMPVPAGVGPSEVQQSVNLERATSTAIGGSDCHPGFLFPPRAGKMVLRDDTASTELRFAAPRGPQGRRPGCEDAVAQAAAVSFAFRKFPLASWRVQPPEPQVCLQADTGGLASVA